MVLLLVLCKENLKKSGGVCPNARGPAWSADRIRCRDSRQKPDPVALCKRVRHLSNLLPRGDIRILRRLHDPFLSRVTSQGENVKMLQSIAGP